MPHIRQFDVDGDDGDDGDDDDQTHPTNVMHYPATHKNSLMMIIMMILVMKRYAPSCHIERNNLI